MQVPPARPSSVIAYGTNLAYILLVFTCTRCSQKFGSSQAHNAHKRHCGLKSVGLSWYDRASQKLKDNLKKRKKKRPACKVCGKEVAEMRAKFCSRSCAAIFRNTGIAKPESVRDKIRASMAGRDLGGTVERVCPVCGETFKTWRSSVQKHCNRECSSKSPMRKSTQRVYLGGRKGMGGGYREGSGKSKSGRYKGMYCGSTYELIFLIYAEENNIPLRRCTKVLGYEYDGVMRKYYPDFMIGETIYEVKGFHTPQSREKARQNPTVVLIEKDEIERMQASVLRLTGKDSNQLALLYDDPLKPTHICLHCKEGFFSKHGARFCSVRCGALSRSKRSSIAKQENSQELSFAAISQG